MRMRENVTAMMILLLFCTNRQVVKLFVVWEREGEERKRETERGRVYLHYKPVVSLSQVHVTVSSSQYQLVNQKQNHDTDTTKKRQ